MDTGTPSRDTVHPWSRPVRTRQKVNHRCPWVIRLAIPLTLINRRLNRNAPEWLGSSGPGPKPLAPRHSPGRRRRGVVPLHIPYLSAHLIRVQATAPRPRGGVQAGNTMCTKLQALIEAALEGGSPLPMCSGPLATAVPSVSTDNNAFL